MKFGNPGGWPPAPEWPYNRSDEISLGANKLVLSNGIQLASFIAREKSYGHETPKHYKIIEVERNKYIYDVKRFLWADVEDWLTSHNVSVVGPAQSDPIVSSNVKNTEYLDRYISERDEALRERDDAVAELKKIKKLISNTGYGMLTVMDILQRSIGIDSIINCGVYFLIYQSEIVYVGQSVDITSRVRTHIGDPSKKFDRISFIKCDKKNLNNTERAYIKMLSPRYNVQHNNMDGIFQSFEIRGDFSDKGVMA